MQKKELFELLSDWNFWAKELEIGIQREAPVRQLVELVTKTNQVICIAGVRRSGKSTIMKQMARQLCHASGSSDNVLIVNFEDERFLDRNLKTLMDIYDVYLEKIRPKKKPYIFLDEVQTVDKWERFVRGVHERKEAASIVVSGSSSKLLSAELATLLTGRHITFQLYPLSFGEFLEFTKAGAKNEADALARRREIKGHLDSYMEYGGFPEVVLSSEKKRILLGYFETIITRDVIERFGIREREKVRTLAKYYLTNISSRMTFNSVSRFLNLPLTTVERFSGHLETASLIFFVSRFSDSLKEQENSPRKVYSTDTGMSNAIGFRLSEKTGKLAENIVAIELKIRQTFNPHLEIYYWKDQLDREVDFVIKDGLDVNELMQVCWDVTSDIETKKRETKSLVKALEELNLQTGLIINSDFEGEEKIKDKTIIYKPMWKWLLRI